jgi:hypothetical protein
MSVDKYLDRTFDRSRYNCLDFVREVWLDLTGIDLASKLMGVFGCPSERTPSRKHFRAFREISNPGDMCLVYMESPKTAPHIGVFIRGRVLHLHERGVEYLPVDIAARGFKRVRYYAC